MQPRHGNPGVRGANSWGMPMGTPSREEVANRSGVVTLYTFPIYNPWGRGPSWCPSHHEAPRTGQPSRRVRTVSLKFRLTGASGGR
jgi:hypothetical protein